MFNKFRNLISFQHAQVIKSIPLFLQVYRSMTSIRIIRVDPTGDNYAIVKAFSLTLLSKQQSNRT